MAIIDQIINSALKSPQKSALVYQNQTVTYGELHTHMRRIAYALNASGAGKGDIVPIRLERSIDAILAMLGVLYAGAAFCNVDTAYPSERVSFIRKDTDSKLCIDAQWMNALGADEMEKPIETSDDDRAFVVYTSGSMGNPKGVVLSQKALSLVSNNSALERTNEDVFFSMASFSFVAVTLDIFVPLVLGATVHILEQGLRKDVRLLADYIQEHRLSTGFMPPQLADSFLQIGDGLLRILLVGSERVRDLYSEKTIIYNVYGASETACIVTSFKIDKPYADGAPIGFALPGSRLHLLDDDGNQAGVGEIGEICVSGQLATEYLNLPELTAENFIPWKTDENDAILYRTGDLGQFREDGALCYVQRKDWMLKVRGYRVEPGEIEAAIVRLTPAKQAVVKGYTNASGETSMFAVYTADEVLAPDEIASAIKEFLPDYMVPSLFEQIQTMPLNQNGKIDRKNIQPPDAANFQTLYEAPQSDEEKQICMAYEELLGLDKVGINDDFFLLGGDSMSVVKLQALLPDLGLTSTEVFKLRTPKELAKATNTAVTFARAEKRNFYPLTHSERQMAAAAGLDPESSAYNVNFAMKIDGELDEQQLTSALNKLVSRYDILRSYYPFENGEYTHKILDEITVDLQKRDFKEISEIPFDISKAPLFRFNLYNNVLHIVMHHIIIDGTGINELTDTLWRLYNGESLQPLDASFLDFAVWQNENATYDKGDDYFKGVFKDGVPECEMPSKAIRPNKVPAADTVICKDFSLTLLDDTAKAYGITTFSLLTSATALTVSKYCGTDDIVLGIPMSGRTLPQIASMPGMFVNTVPVRFKSSASQAAMDFCKKAAENITETAKYQDYPFDRLLEEVDVERMASRNPIYDVVINYLNEPLFQSYEGLTISEYPLKRQLLPYDFSIEFLRRGESLHITLSYSKTLYDDEVAQNMLEQLVSILQRLIQNPNALLLDVTALPEAQKHQILVDFKGKTDDTNKGKTVLDLFKECVKENPGKTAVIFKDRTLSYKELDRLSDKLAAYLVENGIKANSFVPIMLERSEMLAACSLGVLKAGAAYVPLDPNYPGERLEFMLSDSSARLMIADRALSARLPLKDGIILFADEIESLPESQDDNIKVSDENAFVLLYTSGTTGNPKGVALSHRNVVSFCTSYIKSHQITEADTNFAYASFGFDAHVMDIFPALMTGGGICIVPEEMRLDIFEMDRYFAENNVTHGFITTQLGRQFAEIRRKSKLKLLYTGGEAFVPIAPPKDLKLINAYGPTETTLGVTEQLVDRPFDRVPIGKPLDNTAIYIIDKNGELAPVGVAGELLIAGRQVSKGYLNRPDLTAEKFIPNKFSDHPEYAVSYRTGDIARFLPNGALDIVGRNDFQVKIRGYRIELPEIENRIRKHGDIKDAAVVALDAPGGGKCAALYIVSDKTISFDEVRAFILEKLPAQMVPAAVMQIDAIPLNPNGKVDRRKLPAPVFGEGLDSGEPLRPANILEEKIVAAVKDVIGHDQFSLTGSLLRAGLSSLSAIKLMAKLDDELGVAPAVRDFMREPTVAGLENVILKQLLSRREEQPTAETTVRSSYPLSHSQMGIYLDCMKAPESIHYNVPIFFDLPVTIDAERLQKAICTVIENHPMLDVHMATSGDGVVQMRGHFPPQVTLAEMSEDELSKLKAGFRHAFDLMCGPLYRAAVVVTPLRIAVLLDFHHIVFDGASADLFLRSMVEAYEGKPLAPERLDGLAAALADNTQEGSDDWNASKTFFEAKLQDFEGATEVPGDMGAYSSAGLMQEAVQTIDRQKAEAFCKDKAITPAALFAAVTAYTVSRWADSPKVYMSMISSGRGDARLRNSVGMFVRTLPLILERGKNQTVLDFIRAVQQDFNDTVAHENYPFTRIAKDFGYQPSIMYACELGVIDKLQIGGATIELEAPGQSRAKFKLSVHIEERDGQWLFAVQYDENAYSKGMMETFTETLGFALDGLISSPEAPISGLSLLSSKQRELISGFDKRDGSPELTLHRLFEQAAAENADKIALEAIDGVFTYAQLNAEANKLAHGHISRGLQREERVALMLGRTSRVIVAMLGVLKAGGAYIPLDPEYPEERVRHVREDSAAKFLLDEREVDALRENQPDTNPDLDISPNNLAYLIYTSGSTGKPKGVMIEHKGIANYVLPHPENRHVHGLKESASKMLSVTTVAFDMFLKESMTSLCNGLTLVLADEQAAHDPILLTKLFESSNADAFNATPSVMLEYTAYPPLLEAIRRCRVIMCGAEKYPEALLPKLSGSGTRLFNTYGPTEISVSCNAKELTDDSHVTIGAPLYGVCETIADADGNELPCFMIGEMYIGGRGVARGYVNLPEQTAERFITHDGQRMYRSGDLARRLPNGEIEVLGRNDSQIKLRGLRIELGEIETALLNIEGITAVAVIIRKIQGQDQLCAYYVANMPITADDLRDKLGRTLTPYMVPAAYLQLDAMPKTPNGKNDLRALPAPNLLQSGDYEAPQSDTEAALCEVFAKTLNLERVGALDSFFELGGSSLMVTRIVIEAENIGLTGANGTKITYADVFARPTPRELAELLQGVEITQTSQEDDYDYSAINAMLLEQPCIPPHFEGLSGSVLLTGATGFLGIHMLYALLTGDYADSVRSITCLVRKGRAESAKKRLQNMLFYYFEDSFDGLWDKKLFVIDGDMTSEEGMAQIRGVTAQTVINCAANVSHFALNDASFDVNVLGVRNLIDYCRESGARLVHISTTSVGGFHADGKIRDTKLNETMLFFGQSLDNQYVRSKFLAEREILESCLTGLDAKIMRVGNLMARNRDGEFQINARGNSFLGRLRAYAELGCFPYSAYSAQTELAPIDSTAAAILHLCGTPTECRVFHAYNNHYLFMGDIIGSMRDNGIDIRLVEDAEFDSELTDALRDSERAQNLTSLVAYRNLSGGKAIQPVGVTCERTIQALLRKNWHWPETSAEYQRGFIRALTGMGILGGDELV